MKKKTATILLLIAAAVVLLAIVGIFLLKSQNLRISEPTRVNVPDEASYSDLVDSMETHGCIPNHTVFNTLARLRHLPQHVKPGSYRFNPGDNIIMVVQKLYSGNQTPIRVTINKKRTVQQLCDYLGTKLEFTSDSLLMLMQSPMVCRQYGETPQTIIGMFPQNTYELYWNITPKALLNRMLKESETFWDGRQESLKELGLSRQQVLTLASIVEEETNCNEEKPDIASVYLNRYRIGMPLQADPTVKFALEDFSIRRIKNTMLEVDSPYNTYKYAGLPPGPICIPSVASIDAVLKNKKTDYFYFCAKEDFSGRHNFSRTHEEHLSNARKYRMALNERKIW
jgi:UPF0755 protein